MKHICGRDGFCSHDTPCPIADEHVERMELKTEFYGRPPREATTQRAAESQGGQRNGEDHHGKAKHMFSL